MQTYNHIFIYFLLDFSKLVNVFNLVLCKFYLVIPSSKIIIFQKL